MPTDRHATRHRAEHRLRRREHDRSTGYQADEATARPVFPDHRDPIRLVVRPARSIDVLGTSHRGLL